MDISEFEIWKIARKNVENFRLNLAEKTWKFWSLKIKHFCILILRNFQGLL